MLRLRALRVTGYATLLTKVVEVLSAGEQFVHITLMTSIENN
jgi:hypothetical protein